MKRGLILLVLTVLLVFLHAAIAGAVVGVSPAIYRVDFKPNEHLNMVFNFIHNEGIKSDIYVAGDLSKYVKLSRSVITGSDSVSVSLNLPNSIEIPGDHRLFIGSREIVSEDQGFSIVGDVRGVILVRVPYPGEYLKVSLEVPRANAGESVNMKALAENLGKEDLDVSGEIEITDSRETLVKTISLGDAHIASKESKIFKTELNTENYPAGEYNATAIFRYGVNFASDSQGLILGELRLGILNYTSEFEKGKINRFQLEAESFWNDPIEEVYANVTILNYGINFITPSTDIAPWSKVSLTGFFDTSSIDSDNFKAKIDLIYAGKTTSETVDLKLLNNTDYMGYIVVAAIVLLGLISVLFAVIIVILLKRGVRNAKKKKSN